MWIFLFLVAVLAILVVLFLRQAPANEVKKKKPPAPGKLTIVDADVGDSISIHGAGDSFSDLNFTVDRMNRYDANGDETIELSGQYRGRRVFVEVCDDDDVEVSVNTADQDISLGDLGLAESDLVRMDESNDRSDSFSYGGSLWQFDWSGEVGFFSGGSEDGEGYYSWVFKEKGGSRQLTVEKWEGEPFNVVLSRRVNADDVQVFRVN